MEKQIPLNCNECDYFPTSETLKSTGHCGKTRHTMTKIEKEFITLADSSTDYAGRGFASGARTPLPIR